MLRVLLIAETPRLVEAMRAALLTDGCAPLIGSSTKSLAAQAQSGGADVLLVHIDKPGSGLLAEITAFCRDGPCPVVLLAADRTEATVQLAYASGVCIYMADSIDLALLRMVVDAAMAQFAALQRLKTEVADATDKLHERKLVERAKGFLMQHKGISEEVAYHSLRKLAMQRNLRMADVAKQVIAVAEILV